MPFRLDDDWLLVTRTKLPFVSRPPKKPGEGWQDGLGNGYTTFFLSPAYDTGFIWGVGPVISFPSATNRNVGVNKRGSGPSVALIWRNCGPWVVGVVANNVWSLGGPPTGSDTTNSLLLNPFVSYEFGDGWLVGSSPNITADWESAPGKRWTLPVGGGIGKAVRIGGQPVKLQLDNYYNVLRPHGTGPVWSAVLTLTLAVPAVGRHCGTHPRHNRPLGRLLGQALGQN